MAASVVNAVGNLTFPLSKKMSGSLERPVDLRNLITSLITSLFKSLELLLNHTVNKQLSLRYLILKKMDLVCKDNQRVQISR